VPKDTFLQGWPDEYVFLSSFKTRLKLLQLFEQTNFLQPIIT